MRPFSGGFTYLALLMMVAVMSAGLGAAVEVWHTAMQREKERELLFVGNQFRRAIGAYSQAHSRHYPPRLEDLLGDPQQPVTRRYLRKIYRDPITGSSDWGLVLGADGGIAGVHSLSEATPLKVAGFGQADSSLDGAEKYSDWVFIYKPQKRFVVPVKTDTVLNAGKG